VRLGISEPWEFGTEVRADPLSGRIIQIRRDIRADSSGTRYHELAVVQLERPFAYRGLKCEFLLASPRHEGLDFADIQSHEVVSFNFLRISSERASSDDPFDHTRWRSQRTFALIGAMRLEPQ
jgi:hypothetical protein